MIDLNKLKKAKHMPRRIYIMKKLCLAKNFDIEYLFGLFELYGVKNRGKWFWQRATFQGVLKDSLEKFDAFMDRFVKELKSYDESRFLLKMKEAGDLLEDLVNKIEASLEIDREADKLNVKSYLDDNFKSLIKSNLKGLE